MIGEGTKSTNQRRHFGGVTRTAWSSNRATQRDRIFRSRGRISALDLADPGQTRRRRSRDTRTQFGLAHTHWRNLERPTCACPPVFRLGSIGSDLISNWRTYKSIRLDRSWQSIRFRSRICFRGGTLPSRCSALIRTTLTDESG